MNLGEVCTIGNKKPENLIHIVLDNGVYYSTDGMKTYSP
jgi:thiamine pyrophosphate-dependent acetolactate synthase large subunit-like protein